MQKVVGSSPIIRSSEAPARPGVLFARRRAHARRAAESQPLVSAFRFVQVCESGQTQLFAVANGTWSSSATHGQLGPIRSAHVREGYGFSPTLDQGRGGCHKTSLRRRWSPQPWEVTHDSCRADLGFLVRDLHSRRRRVCTGATVHASALPASLGTLGSLALSAWRLDGDGRKGWLWRVGLELTRLALHADRHAYPRRRKQGPSDQKAPADIRSCEQSRCESSRMPLDSVGKTLPLVGLLATPLKVGGSHVHLCRAF